MNCFRENKNSILILVLLSFLLLNESVFSENREIFPETPLGMDDVPIPEKNVITRAKYELGKMLFLKNVYLLTILFHAPVAITLNTDLVITDSME